MAREEDGTNSSTTVDDQLSQPLLVDYQEKETKRIPESNDNNDVEEALTESILSDEQQQIQNFSLKGELMEMGSLALPLAISFFCRMGMASTDSAFVGHIHDGSQSAETYLAAAVLSDMVVNVLMVPPLAFNQVLNALVGQAIGSGNPKMAGLWLQQSMFWLGATMLPCLIGCFYVEPILLLLDFPLEIAKVAGVYAKFNIFWPIPNGWYQCMRFYFQAQGLPKPAMYNNMIFLLVNAALNWIFVFGGPFRYMALFGHWKGLGFIGAAISLSISRVAQSFCYFCYMFLYRRHHVRTWPGLSWKHHTKPRTLEFLKQSVPNMGTLLFQQCASQATTVLVGRLGELAIATSSAMSTVTVPWSGTLSATTWTVSSVRVGYHLGRGDGHAAKKTTWIVLHFITIVNILMAVLFVPLKTDILEIATDDPDILSLGSVLVPAVLIGTYLNSLVGNITSGVFSGMGRPLIATILSFGLELPLSIGGTALLILYFKTNLLGVYWFQALSGGFEALILFGILAMSNWNKCAEETQARQEASSSSNSNEAEETTQQESLSSETEEVDDSTEQDDETRSNDNVVLNAP
jgi:MATE family multidrug resistance protein